ncbi:cytochrome P450 [Mycotypha africana]|uniref:cytochrome P450 n=1 Tax=Mycotypha africana TaxID=64632 RepID=UPI0023018122|nr:cytochrome P450 [Mycotypha africana]KAI8979229.1 cytochrome P450 [Mycotypha africana]
MLETDNTTSLIAVLKDSSKTIEQDGRIIRFGNGANLNTVRGLVADKLNIVAAPQDICFFTREGKLLESIDDLRSQQVVYVDLEEQIKDVIPGPPRLPLNHPLRICLGASTWGNRIAYSSPFAFHRTLGFMRQFEKYGPLIKVALLRREMIVTNDPKYAELLVKESDYFTKKIGDSGLREIKEFAGQGLFTTDTDEMDWKLAHKLLMPAFSPRAIKTYQKEMGLITQQTIKVLETFAPTEPVEILEWTTNLTFETIGRIGFGYEFNLLNGRDQEPNEFIEAMGYCLRQSLQRTTQAQFVKYLPIEANRKYDRSVKLMHDIVDKVVAERKSSPDANNKDKDLLGFMLTARDEHDLGLSDENIRDQVVTFLIAGHDTTANTLAWALYELSRHPDVKAKLLQEIADCHITADTLPTPEQISSLKYMHQLFKETLRKYPPVRTLSKYCKKDVIVPGGYRIKTGANCLVNVYCLHHNESVYPDHNRFDPDRWTPEEEQKRSRYAWLPFSTGPRGCIGMAFALQEAKTVLAMLLHRFDFVYEGPDVNYDPKSPTTKPLGLRMTLHPRKDFPDPRTPSPPGQSRSTANSDSHAPQTSTAPAPQLPTVRSNADPPSAHLPPVTVLFGTQTGTAQDYANQIASQAKSFGFTSVHFSAMDQWKVLTDGKFCPEDTASKRPDKELLVICTATYNGQPPDSAEKFNKFLDEKMKEPGHEHLLKGLSFAVFGLGNKNWRTYQQFPRKVSNGLEELGAEQFFLNGEGDADKDMDAAFNEWCAHFWMETLNNYGIAAASESKPVVPTAVSSSTPQPSSVKVRFIQPNDKDAWEQAVNNRYGESNAVLRVNREIQKEGSPRSTRHLEIDISNVAPADETKPGQLYSPGDHLEVMPENDSRLVEAIALRFGWILDAVFEIDPESLHDVSPRSLAANIKGPCTVRNMLTFYADLLSPPSRAVLGCFANQLKSVAPDTAAIFEKLVMPDTENKDPYPEFIKKHRTLLDLQEAFPQVNKLDPGQFLASVPVIQPRRYSIASSPLLFPHSVHLTVGVVDDVIEGKHYDGLASSYLKRSAEGTLMRAHLKSSKKTFSMPSDPSVPIIMIAAGTGLAPFRGFLQDRKAQKCAGEENVGNCVLFFGCRRSDQDYIYNEELEDFVKTGVISHLHVAFSRSTDRSPKKYVQHQILSNATEVWSLIYPSDPNAKPATVYVCGSGAMSRDVRRTFRSMALAFGAARDEEEADKLIDKLGDEGRYLCDVWG